MPYITFTTYPDVPGRTYRNVKQDEALTYYAEIDEVRAGETEINSAQYSTVTPYDPPAPVVPPTPSTPTTAEKVAAALEAANIDPTLKSELAGVIQALLA